MTGKQGELFLVHGSGTVQRCARVTPSGAGAVTASASRRGGQSALRFSRLADSRRLAWVKKVVETMNSVLVPSSVEHVLKVVLICGGGGLQTLLKSDAVDKEIHHTLRSKIRLVPSGIDPTESQRGKKLRKVPKTDKGTTLLDHELYGLIRTML